MTIDYQFGDMGAHGATIRAQAAASEAEPQAIVRDVLAAGDLWGRAARQRPPANGATAGSNMASTDSAVGSTWA